MPKEQLYVRKDILERRLQEGYTEIATGRGEWVHDQKIVGVFIFYHPDGRITSYEHPKFRAENRIHTGIPFEKTYPSSDDLQRHCNLFRIQLNEKSSLAELVKRLP